MANTFSQLFFHVVFSTKHRSNFIHQEIEERVWEYIGGVARTHTLTSLRVGGIENHIHGLMMAKPIVRPCDIPMWLKSESSKWIHHEFPTLSEFGWQDGYGAFAVSQSAIIDVEAYIARQEEHHRRMSFQEEFVEFLRRHELEYDERYLWV